MPPGEFRLCAGSLVYNAVSPGRSRVFRELQEIHGLSRLPIRSAQLANCTLQPNLLGLIAPDAQAIGLLKRMVRFRSIAFAYIVQNHECPTLAASLLLRLGWDTSMPELRK
jgi:hypothetical protein